MAESIRVEVVYADPHRQFLRVVDIPPGSKVIDAVDASGILAQLPGFVPAGYGIFGRSVAMDAPLRDGDRVELYRPLQIDPKQARRNRART
ncbi:MAG: RnfH family protein [Xanthomonadales bacterium PRO7]|jgi:putative ubiquitin-RnfH superfamily antitoxin RatB of RatAB toxin-antitoxin module|nr:RnfH family protein [Xanthomonadales bacterium PRO7]HMM56796.1 RnfH family protein [Rudaea sp.]